MFCRSWSAEKVTGGGGAEVCAIAEDEVPKITIRQVLTSEDLGEKGTRALQSDMICGVSEKLSASGTHAKPFVMKRARAFFVTTGFLIYFGLLAPQLPLAASPALQTWVATWGSSQQIPEPQNELPVDDLRDATVRQIFHLSVGGLGLRVHMSNAFGTEALHFTSVHIARPLSTTSPAIDPTSDRQLTFASKNDVIVPPGADFVSDPVDLKVAPLSDIAVTFHLDAPPARESSHPGSRATSYYVHGDAVGAATLIEPKHVDHWFQISEIDVQVASEAAAVVVLGDSITDGHGATTNGNDRWTDVLAARLQGSPQTRNIGVSNQGIGGNHLLTDGLGPNALSRFDRDVLAPAGVRWLIVFEGVNDLGGLARTGEVPPAEHAALVERVLSAYRQIVERAHAHGLQVFGATITPYVGSNYYHPSPVSEADRQAVNQWIRAAGHFDGAIDFDAVVRDPNHLDQLLPAFDCGDHLHPSPVGYKAMGEAIPLTFFAR
jgi:lysophospholipase L1-like esterase